MRKYLVKFKNQEKDCAESHIIDEMNPATAIHFAQIYYNIPSNDIIHVEELSSDGENSIATLEEDNTLEDDCIPSFPYDILFPSNTKEKEEEEPMTFFNVNWNDYTESLASIAAPENWSNDTYPNNGILTNYITHTYKKLKSEKKVICTKEYGLFNTGLFTKYYDPIYAYQSENNVEFLTSYKLGGIGIEKYPERADYFSDPSLLLFDWHYKINIHYDHILDDPDNRQRIPKEILESENLINILNGSIDTMKKRVSANYKLAIPQYFDGKVQLLLPLCLRSDDKPDLALVVTKAANTYQGHTCITLDMAYNNARLIAKPENNWLNP